MDPIKVQIFGLSTARMKINQIPCIIFQATSPHLDFATPFSVMTHNSSEIFHLKQYMLWTKRAHQCTIFRLLGALMTKAHLIPHAIFKATRLGFFEFCITVQYHER